MSGLDGNILYTTHDTYLRPGDAELVMTRQQFDALAEVLATNVDLDTVAVTNGEPEVAKLIENLIGAIQRADKAS